MPRKVILDVDTGIDDALALLLALKSPELEVVGVCCVAGNVTIDKVVGNTLAVLDLAGATAPVAVGARKPLVARLRTATLFHGRNGLGEVQLPASPRRPLEEDAASFLVRRVREQPGEITVIAVGPLTNIALALVRDAGFAPNLAGLVVMGGAVGVPGNATPAAEANFSNDPEAAAVVVDSGAPLRLVDLGATHQAILPREAVDRIREEALSPIGQFALRVLRFYGEVARSIGYAGAVLHDPLAVGLAALPELATFLPVNLVVETAGAHTRGASIGNFSRFRGRLQRVGDHDDMIELEHVTPNASVARQIDAPRFITLFLERLELA